MGPRILAIMLCMIGVAASATYADTTRMTYQGTIGGQATRLPVTTSSMPATFRLYDHLLSASPIWSETVNLNIQGGHFSTVLGGGMMTGLSPSLFSTTSDRYLSVQLDTGSESTTKIQIGAVPYAFRAYSADTLLVVPNELKYPGNAAALWIDSNDNVGIGTTTPSYRLDVSGNLRVKNAIIRPTHSTTISTTGPQTVNLPFGDGAQDFLINFTVSKVDLSIAVSSEPPAPCELTVTLINYSPSPVSSVSYASNSKSYFPNQNFSAPGPDETQVYHIFYNGTDYLIWPK